ncbi:MAG: RES family NAD+ phosphorylase [Gemmatimonadota bacterium]|nr:RES family NAD+ phosphorylase [Gemmatimonadota bacterium]
MAITAYRVCKTRHAPDDGSGAARVGGRWNSPGRAVIYCGVSQAGAMLEILAHANRIKLPGTHHVATFTIPESLSTATVNPDAVAGWDAPGSEVARKIGDAWLERGESAVLFVPSAIARPYEQNVVINPVHADYKKLVMSQPVPVIWDERLLVV